MKPKKDVHVSGVLATPLREGSRVLIRCGGSFIYTSLVVEIRESSADRVCFETMNSVYHVSLEPIPIKASLPDMPARCA